VHAMSMAGTTACTGSQRLRNQLHI
jgi:hypothetical protein